MRVVCVFRENTEYSREVEEYIEEFSRRTEKEIEKVNPDSINGGNFAQIYDVVEYPTILALDNNGKILEEWRGMPLPRFDEVSYYASEKSEI